jgi:alpha-mannosidase
MSEQKTIHILSNTHWDREWRFPFAETQMHLVKLLDKLIEHMEDDPNYKYFNFDSQTIFLEDYLKYRPENRERLKKLISDKRLIVGPWYTLPEEYSVNGESLVRNLLMGEKIGNEFGNVSKVGYTPTSYGQISQIAQLYDGFGIDGIIFYRGIHHSEGTNEYFLESPDGSKILGVKLSKFVGRGAFFIYVAHTTMHDSKWTGYKWGDKKCLSFHTCNAENNIDHEQEPELIRAPYKDTCNLENVKLGIIKAMDDILNEATSDCLLLMDGMDSAYSNKHLPKILEEANKVNPNWKFIHSSLPNYLKDLKSKIDPKKLTILRGERRHPSSDGMFNAFLKDSLSSRMYIKQRNFEVESILLKWAEPFANIAENFGTYEYPSRQLEDAWKKVLSCHAHDSIGGLSPDQIHKDMMWRFDQAEIVGKTIRKDSLGEIVAKIDTTDADSEDVMITLFNPLPFEINAVPKVFVDLPREKEYRAFSIYDTKDEKVEQQIISREESYLITTEHHEMPMTSFTTKWKLSFLAKNIPALGYKTFILKPESGKTSNYGSQITATNTMENEFLKVRIESNGTLTVVDKITEQKYENLLYFEDSGEAGDCWMHIKPYGVNSLLYSQGSNVNIELVEDGPVISTFKINLKWELPTELNYEKKSRSEEKREMKISSYVSLKKGDSKIHIHSEVDNNVKDHRLRAMFDSGFNPKKATVHGQFDMVERDVHLPNTSDWLEPITGTNPNFGTVCVENSKRGLALFSKGLTECEVNDNESGTVSLTLLRSYGYPKMSGLGREDRVVRINNDGSQCLGKQKYDLSLYFYKSDWENANVLKREAEFKYPVTPIHHSKFDGKELSREHSFFKLEPDILQLSAIKKSDKDDFTVVRFYNPTNENIDGKFWSYFKIKKVELLKINEDKIKEIKLENENVINIACGKKKIITIGIFYK